MVFVAIWTAGWAFAWERYLFDSLGTDPAAGLTIIANDRGSTVDLYTGAIVGFVLGVLGFISLVLSSIIKPVSRPWNIILISTGGILTFLALLLPVTFPSQTELVIDENTRIIALQHNWLHATSSDTMAFDDIDRVGLRVQRKAIPGGCQVATGLSLIRTNMTWLDVPYGIDHEYAGQLVADIVGAEVRLAELREC
jgi:hypothetical protein